MDMMILHLLSSSFESLLEEVSWEELKKADMETSPESRVQITTFDEILEGRVGFSSISRYRFFSQG